MDDEHTCDGWNDVESWPEGQRLLLEGLPAVVWGAGKGPAIHGQHLLAGAMEADGELRYSWRIGETQPHGWVVQVGEHGGVPLRTLWFSGSLLMRALLEALVEDIEGRTEWVGPGADPRGQAVDDDELRRLLEGGG